jgi:hypothetical protein
MMFSLPVRLKCIQVTGCPPQNPCQWYSDPLLRGPSLQCAESRHSRAIDALVSPQQSYTASKLDNSIQLAVSSDLESKSISTTNNPFQKSNENVAFNSGRP